MIDYGPFPYRLVTTTFRCPSTSPTHPMTMNHPKGVPNHGAMTDGKSGPVYRKGRLPKQQLFLCSGDSTTCTLNRQGSPTPSFLPSFPNKRFLTTAPE